MPGKQRLRRIEIPEERRTARLKPLDGPLVRERDYTSTDNQFEFRTYDFDALCFLRCIKESFWRER